MKNTIRYAALLFILAALALSGCSPKTDVTDPLSEYSVDINVPFVTASAVPTQSSGYTKTGQTVKITGWLNEVLDSSVQNAYNELSLGSIGTAVKNLQKRLIELGYMTGTASGTFDQATAQAVRLFEIAYGRTATGIATKLMQYYLFQETAKIYNGVTATKAAATVSSEYRRLERGDTGSDVTRLQNRLIELGYLSSKATGIFDANTENAVKGFEAVYGKQRTGIATTALQQYLFSSNAYRADTVTPTPTPRVTVTPQPTMSDTYKALQYGSRGTEVKKLQERLKELKYYSGSIDGVYGNATVEAVKAFESAYGQAQTGIATSGMQRYLYSEDALVYGSATPTPTLPASVTGYSTLTKGSYGEEVVNLQKRLIELGYLKGKADGYYGDATANAVKAFENRYGRTQSGVATVVMQQYLYAEDALSYSSQNAQSETEYAILSEGSYGTAVYALQLRLIELNYLSGNADGYYGTSTVNAVKLFEKAYGHTETGIASVALQETLFSDGAIANVAAKTTTSAYSKLKKGDSGNHVAQLQLRLIELGYLSGTVDGYFGEGTESAVKAFEAAYGKAETGIATSALQSYLFSDDAIPNTNGEIAVSYTTLSDGSSGNEVTALQNRLIELGYMTGKADGKYGKTTSNAVKLFQKTLGLKQTGAATAALQKELYSSSAKKYVSDEIVTVNKTAFVTAPQTNVYAKYGDTSPAGILKIGAEVKLLRTRGEWAEIQNSSGAVGYAYLKDFAIAESKPAKEETAKTVNAYAMVIEEQILVFAEPNNASDMLGTLSKGATVTWTRQSGIWAEIKNSGGKTGYVYAENLVILEEITEDTPALTGESAYKSLKTGDTGTNVKKLQTRLKALGYFDGDIGGNYLTKTTTAVKAFQAMLGLDQTGNASSALQEILFSEKAPKMGSFSIPAAGSYEILTLGGTGESVQNLQIRLLTLGYLNAAEVNFGTFDAATRAAIIDIQIALGLTSTDGIATEELQAFLFSEAGKTISR